MAYGPKQLFGPYVIASGASSSSIADLGDKSYRQMAIYGVTMGADFNVFGGMTTATIAPVMERVNTAPVQYQSMVVASATSAKWAVFQAPPLRYIQMCATGTVANGASFYIAVDD